MSGIHVLDSCVREKGVNELDLSFLDIFRLYTPDEQGLAFKVVHTRDKVKLTQLFKRVAQSCYWDTEVVFIPSRVPLQVCQQELTNSEILIRINPNSCTEAERKIISPFLPCPAIALPGKPKEHG